MKTSRSMKYYTLAHGVCSKNTSCVLQKYIDSKIYCQDKVGAYSDYCKHFNKRIGALCYITWLNKFDSWKELKNAVKQSRNASFALPLIQENGMYAIGNPSDYEESTEGIKGVIYTTDEKIKEVYGIKMQFYSYTFLKEVFKKELGNF